MAIILTIGEGISRSDILHTSVQSIFPNISQLAVANYDFLAKPDAGVDPDVIMIGYPDDVEKSISLCQKLKRNDRLKSTPILFIIPAKADQTIQKRALEAGAEAFLSVTANEFELEVQLNLMFKIKEANNRSGRGQENKAKMNKGDLCCGQIFSSNLPLTNEEKLRKANRLYKLIRQISQSIVRTKEKEKLLPEICRITVEQGEFRMAWIGFINEETRLIEPYSIAGFEDGYLSVINPISVSDIPEGRGPAGTALREGRHSVCNDYACDPQVEIWREDALKRGYRSSIALPIKQKGIITGAFSLYTSIPQYFDEEEIDLLNEIASDISFALDTFDLEKRHREALATLIESEEKYRCLTENMKDVVWIMDTNTEKLTYVSPSATQLIGFTPEEIISKPVEATLPPEQFHKLIALINLRKSLLLEGKLQGSELYYTIEVELLCKDGTSVQTEIVTKLYLNKRTGKVELHGVTRDITKRTRAEEKLRESEQLYRLLFNNSFDAFLLTTADGTLQSANPAMCKMFGRTEDEISGLGRNVLLDVSDSRLTKALREREKTGYFLGELTGIRSDGTKFPIEISSTLFSMRNGALQTSAIIRDITSRKKAEEEILQARERFQVLFEQAPLGMAMVDTSSGKFYDVNARFVEITGYTESELKSMSWQEITHSEDLQRDEEYMERFRKIKINEYHLEKRYIKRDKSVIWISLTVKRLHNDRSNYSYHLSMVEDITLRKKEEEDRKILFQAVEQSPVSVVITDLNAEIQYVNPRFSEITGYSWKEAIGKNPRILKSSDTTEEEYKKMWDTILSGKEWHGIFRNIKKNGESYFESAMISPVNDNSGKIIQFVAIKEDITERRKSELLIKTLSATVEQSPSMVAITNSKGEIEFANHQFMAFLQYTPDEVLGRQAWVFNPKHLDERMNKDMWQTLKQGRAWKSELRNRKKDKTEFWEQVTVSPLSNEKGEIDKYIILMDDISEKKQLLDALVSAKDKAEESDRLKSAFLANMSHEIRTPLNSIIGFSELLLDPDFDQPQQSDFVHTIKQSGKNLLAIINNIMDISKLESGQVSVHPKSFCLNQLILDICKEYSNQVQEKSLELRVNIPEKNICIINDETKTKQILANFVSNAIKFTPKGYVEIGFKSPTDSVEFYIKDSGIGIPPEFHDKIFERFRQVETSITRQYGGNGLGLAISKQLAKLMDGKVWMESELGKGSTFYLSLPAFQEN